MRHLKHCFAVLTLAAMAIFANGCNHDNDNDSGDSGGGCANGHCHQHHNGSNPALSQLAANHTAPVEVPVAPQVPATIVLPPAPPSVTVTDPSPATAPETAPAVISGEDPGSDTPDDLNFSDSKGHIAKKGVVVAINRYPGAPLEGCVDDGTDIVTLHTKGLKVLREDNGVTVLLQSYGFKRSNIKFLTDENATTANIRAALVWMTKGTQAGDMRMFWYSGHGAEDAVSSDAAHEPDHLNQLMCPVDFDWSREHELIDKDLVSIFAQMPPGIIFNWGSDSCHSGDLDKNIHHHKTKSKAYPITPDYVSARVAKVKARIAKNEAMHRGMINGLLDVGYLSGCKSDQTSADSSDANGRPCGAMTHYFLQVLAQGMVEKPLSDIATKEREILTQDQYDQLPQAEGARASKGWLRP